MAQLLTEREETSIRLLTLEVSEGEVVTYALALRYLLENSKPETVEKVIGAYRDEVEGMLADLLTMVDLAEWETEISTIEESVREQ